MGYDRSTLVRAALAACGLAAAAHLLHPGAPEARPRLARVVSVTAEAPAPSPWTDPPIVLRGAEPAAVIADSARMLAPRPTVALPPDARMAPPLPSALVAPPPRQNPADPLGDLIRGLGRDGQA